MRCAHGQSFETAVNPRITTKTTTATPARAPLALVPVEPSPFNGRGSIETPSFKLSRRPKPGGARLILWAHQHTGAWMHGWEWELPVDTSSVDTQLPHRDGPRHPSCSGAVDIALSDSLSQMARCLGERAREPRWAAELEAVRAWGRAALARARLTDADLPLHGLTFIDLLSGSGGLALGFVQQGAACGLGCEIDPEARRMFVEHIAPKRMAADLLALDAKALKADILLIGLVCTAYSKAGGGLGSRDPKLRALYAKARELLAESDVKIIIVECAKELLTLRGGKDAAGLRLTLTRAGFRVQHRSICASRFGVPQKRERCFIVATRVGVAADPILGFIFPTGSDPTAAVEDILETSIPARIAPERIELRKEALAERAPRLHEIGRIDGKACQGYRVYDTRGLGPTLCASSAGPGRNTGAFLIGGRARPLSPREAFRMQGFPEWVSPHSVDSHALRHAGNAVAVPLARSLAASLAASVSLRKLELGA